MKNRNPIKAAFQMDPIRLPLECLIEQRPVKNARKRLRSYAAILSSLREVGLVQPLVVCPAKGETGKYKILDGHLRLYALRELGAKDVLCVISTDDERYTFDAQVNHISPIQRHKMIKKAVEKGVDPKRIAAALNIDEKTVRSEAKLLDGIHQEAVDILKDKPIHSKAIKALRRVKPLRQIDIAQNMCAANNFSESYAKALVAGTRAEQMVSGRKTTEAKAISPEYLARMEREQETVKIDIEQIKQSYAENFYTLVVIRNYLKTLLSNAEIERFLKRDHPDMLPELDKISKIESITV